MPPAPLVIGQAGGAGSGKTTVANVILQRISRERTAYVPHEGYSRRFSNDAAMEMIVACLEWLLEAQLQERA